MYCIDSTVKATVVRIRKKEAQSWLWMSFYRRKCSEWIRICGHHHAHRTLIMSLELMPILLVHMISFVSPPYQRSARSWCYKNAQAIESSSSVTGRNIMQCTSVFNRTSSAHTNVDRRMTTNTEKFQTVLLKRILSGMNASRLAQHLHRVIRQGCKMSPIQPQAIPLKTYFYCR